MLSISAELARRVLDEAPDAMIIIDVSGRVRYANRQVSTLFGYTYDEMIGFSIETLMPERLRAHHIKHRERYGATPRLRPMGVGLNLFGRRRDGSEFPVEISLSPIEDGEQLLVAAAVRDVSERKRVEADLVLARQAAERERQAADEARDAADRARQIADAARESADRANMGKSRFLATASHDLRQPLQTLSLLNGTFRRMFQDPETTEVLVQEERAITAMSRLLNALLDISKLESGAVKPEPTDFTVGTLFEELRREFSGIAQSKGLVLEIDPCDTYVHSDPALVQQILRNLVSNAIKYTPEGLVRLRCLQEAACIRVQVLDTGIGVPEDRIPYIFDEFYQVGVPTNSSRDGYGLGLSIVQRIVKLLNLELDVASELGKGSAFTLALPRGRGQVRTTQTDRVALSEAVQRIGTPRVLLVEDDRGVRDATRMLLKAERYHITAVSSLAEALQAAHECETIDLLIADYHLSDGETGTEVITKVREALGFSLKAVLVTGDTSSAIKDLPRDPHMRVTSKPIKADELLTLLRTLLTEEQVTAANEHADSDCCLSSVGVLRVPKSGEPRLTPVTK
jgi:two-component system, sensor histidine kinase